jgi:hypothetical protein
MIKPGDIIFFKSVTRKIGRREPEIKFKGGSGFAVMLGIVPPFGKPPEVGHLMALMGGAGYISFDDVREFLSEEQMKICITKFEDKYLPKPEKPKSQLILPPPLVEQTQGETDEQRDTSS